ncbi:AC4 protein [Triumfetta yellow mosaic virus]|uniref:AC4 protein n=1 Tax=Triumfetta yellow mosaic virus TaxID=1825950 RepID=A0A165F1I3_9GEMI|nr:AC4 protein [Triumfetta yellow mosaic virus]AMY16579.1 AC4 protein [Triumfetta yellow mosaic virus]
MEHLISMLCCSSKGNSSAQIVDSSTCDIPNIPMSVMEITNHVNPPPTPNHIYRRTEITSNGVLFRSTEDVLEEVNRQLTMQQQRR